MARPTPWPFARTLQRIERFVPPALVDRATFDQIQKLGERLPDVMSSFYFETRLSEGSDAVDFACSIAANDGRRSGQGRAELLCDSTQTLPEWSRLSSYLSSWSRPRRPEHQVAPLLWLGFDHISAVEATLPLPCVSFSLSARVGAPGSAGVDHAVRLVLAELNRLVRCPIDGDTTSVLAEHFRQLPEGARVMYASAMLSRPDEPLKLNVLIRSYDAPSYLDRVGWRGSLPWVTEVLHTYCQRGDHVRLDLTLNPGGRDVLGIELLSKELTQDPQSAHQLAERMGEAGLGSRQKISALRQWSGSSTERYPSHGFSSCLARTWYAKFCCRPGQALRAKAYLGFSPRHFSIDLGGSHA